MRYKDVACVCCGRLFTDEDDVVVCPVCGAPHHRACWMETGRCAKNDLHESGYAWAFPVKEAPQPEPQASARQEAQGPMLHNGEKVVPCPRCGTPNYEHDIYCLRCGMRLDGEDTGSRQDPDDPDYDYNEDMNSYREMRGDFDRFGGISPEAPVDGIPCAEYSDFVGGARPGRIIRRVSTMERYGRKLSWMWAALFFGPIWYFWRKMKKEGAVFAILVVFFAALLGVVQLDGPTVKYYKQVASLAGQVANGSIGISEMQERAVVLEEAYRAEEEKNLSTARWALYNVLQYCLLAGLPLLSGLLAVPLYRRHVKSEIQRIRGKCSSMPEYAAALRAEGGTSTGGAILGVAFMLIAFFCAIYLPMLIAVFII